MTNNFQSSLFILNVMPTKPIITHEEIDDSIEWMRRERK
jgi:hypothetical protein